MKQNKINCDRCGVCCSSGVCEHGIEDNRGLCRFLEFGITPITTCILIKENKIPLKDVGFKKGCVLKRAPESYSYYKVQMNNKLQNLKNRLE